MAAAHDDVGARVVVVLGGGDHALAACTLRGGRRGEGIERAERCEEAVDVDGPGPGRLAVVAVLIYLKFKEGRTKLLGKESAMGRKRRERKEAQEASAAAALQDEKRD